MFRQLTDRLYVSPQISVDQVETAKALGVTMIINNRPDDEEPGQTNGAAVEAAAIDAGVAYAAVPVAHGGFAPWQLDGMAAAMEQAGEGKILAYCRSGTRSTLLWALTRARAELVRESSLAAIARGLELGPRLVMGPGEMKSGGHRRDSILADAVEAIVAAIYLDVGYEACRTVVLPWFEAAIAALPPPHKVGKDARGNDNIKSAGWGVVDIYAQFKPMQDLQLNVGVFNLFDKKPPVVGGTIGSTSYNGGNTYPSSYDALGRRFAVSALGDAQASA